MNRLYAGILLLWGLIAPGAVLAHGSGQPFLPEDGIAIPSLTHGQMAVIARHRAEILTRAARHYPPDDTLRRLTNYAAIQRAWCLWGLMPGTVSDEASPFNICAHAYLAATRDALLRLDQLRPDDRGVSALIYRVDHEMIAEGSALALCQYSADGFSTALLIRPDWRNLWSHFPSLAALALVLAGVAGGIVALLHRPVARPAA